MPARSTSTLANLTIDMADSTVFVDRPTHDGVVMKISLTTALLDQNVSLRLYVARLVGRPAF
jgi:hypothetical protein